MTAKEFLRLARGVDRRIEIQGERIERLREKLEAGRMSSLTGMPRGGASDWSLAADHLIELERRYLARCGELGRMKVAAADAIGQVEEMDLRELLELYYLDGLTWESVAEKMGVDVRTVYRMHGRALLRVRVPEGWWCH